jgi:hypothetical protein
METINQIRSHMVISSSIRSASLRTQQRSLRYQRLKRTRKEMPGGEASDGHREIDAGDLWKYFEMSRGDFVILIQWVLE